jgi:hypothetical protein
MRKIVKLSLSLAILAGSLASGFATTADAVTIICRPACCSRDANGTCVAYAGCTNVNGRCVCSPCPV